MPLKLTAFTPYASAFATTQLAAAQPRLVLVGAVSAFGPSCFAAAAAKDARAACFRLAKRQPRLAGAWPVSARARARASPAHCSYADPDALRCTCCAATATAIVCQPCTFASRE